MDKIQGVKSGFVSWHAAERILHKLADNPDRDEAPLIITCLVYVVHVFLRIFNSEINGYTNFFVSLILEILKSFSRDVLHKIITLLYRDLKIEIDYIIEEERKADIVV